MNARNLNSIVKSPARERIRLVTRVCAVVIVAAGLLYALIAPMLLALAVLYFVAGLAILLAEPMVDRWCFTVAVVCVLMFFGIYFAPLWIEEMRTLTPKEHLALSEKYRDRGQLFGDKDKARAHLRAAADGGNAEAQDPMGSDLAHHPRGIINRNAVKWLKAAATQGHTRAQELLEKLESAPNQ